MKVRIAIIVLVLVAAACIGWTVLEVNMLTEACEDLGGVYIEGYCLDSNILLPGLGDPIAPQSFTRHI